MTSLFHEKSKRVNSKVLHQKGEGEQLKHIFKAVIFDMDGVLVNSEPIHNRAWQEVLEGYGITVTDEELGAFAGVNAEHVCDYLEKKHAIGSLRTELIIKKRTAYMRRAELELELLPDVMETLTFLKTRWVPLAVASASSKAQVLQALEHTGILSFFDCISHCEEVVRSKPDPEIYSLTARKLSALPQDILVIEDSHYGLRAAKAAGMYAVGLTTSYDRERLMEAGAARAFDSFAQILSWLSGETALD